MLSKLGHKVLVLEAAKTPGQCTMTHKGLPFDVSRPRLRPLITMTHSLCLVRHEGTFSNTIPVIPDFILLLGAVGVPLGGVGGDL